MKYNRLSRRMFLEGAGKAAIAIPFLPSLFSETAMAANPALPKYIHVSGDINPLYRMLTTPLQNASFPRYSMPAGTTPNSVPWIQKDADTKYQSLREIANYEGKVSWMIDEKWNPYLSRLLLISNAHAYIKYNNHNSSSNSCASIGNESTGNGAVYGPKDIHCNSVDFLIEQAFQRSNPGALGTLRINLTKDDGGWNTFCFGKVNGVPTRLPMMMSVDELRLKVLSALGGQTQPPVMTNARKTRIDSVLEDFKALMGHRRISSVDKQRLGHAADLWQSIDQKLGTTTPSTQASSSATCSAPTFGATPDDWGGKHRLALDMVSLALACGLSRNVAYTLMQGGDNIDDRGQMHGWNHDLNDPVYGWTLNNPFFSSLMKWRADKILYLAGRLDNLQDETGQSLLNSSLITWGGEFSYIFHSMLGHNLVALGGANGKLDMGWHVDAGAAPINRFHMTNMLAMGLQMSDIEKSGEPGFGEISRPFDTGTDGKTEKTSESDYDGARVYDTSKIDYFAAADQRRKPFAYLK